MAKVTVLSKENIKPSQSTSNSLPSIDLSLLDQLAPPIYTNILFFYSTYSPNTSEKLKSSLSQTLKYFYPFAGRIRETGKGKVHVECNDEGVLFVETRVTGATLESIRHGPAVELFNELLPIKKSIFDCQENSPLVGVQINVLNGGGFILGVSICHLIADGASMSMFLNWWSRAAREFSDNVSLIHKLPRFDCASVFPPQEMIQSTPQKTSSEDNSAAKQDIAIRCFNIDSKDMDQLKQVSGGQPTRVEAVSALLWRCIKRAQSENMLSMAHCVNFRKQMAPALSQESIGNMWVTVDIIASETDTNSKQSIEQDIRRAVRGVDEQFIKTEVNKMWDVKEGKENGMGKDTELVKWIFTSWCRMGWYECDFGFEEPVWVACGLTDMRNVCILMDTKDGHGMEVWLWMAIEEMGKIENDNEFRRFVSSSN